MTAIELLGQAQALQHDPTNASNTSGRAQRSKGTGNGSRPHTPDRKATPSSESIDPRRIDELTLKTKTKLSESGLTGASSLSSATKRYQPYLNKRDFQVLPPGQFVLPEKVLSGPVSTTPRVRPSAASIHSNALMPSGGTFQGKPVLIGNLDVVPGVTSLKEGVKMTSSLPQRPVTTTTQSYSYAMSVTGIY